MWLGRGSDKWLIKYLDKSTDVKKLSVTDGWTDQSTDIASYRVACTQLKMNLVTRNPRIALKEKKARNTATPVACGWAGAVMVTWAGAVSSKNKHAK